VKARLLLASTSEVYGDPEVHPQPEEYWGRVNPIGLRSCYDEGKRVAETLCFDYRRQNGVDARVVRIFNTYGPRMALDDGRVVSNFCVSALTGKPLLVYGDGSQTRSFCHVSDLTRGLLAAMECETVGAEGPINLGNPEERTVLELANKVLELSGGSTSAIEHRDLPADDPVRRQPVIERARQILGWEPRVGLDEGLRGTIEDFRVRLKAEGRLK
jgi:UDP-glucuronate decarboxylase